MLMRKTVNLENQRNTTIAGLSNNITFLLKFVSNITI